MTQNKIAKIGTIPTLTNIKDVLKYQSTLTIHDSAGKIVNGELIIKGTLLSEAKKHPIISVNLDYIIELTSEFLGLKISSDQIQLMVESLLRQYPLETMEDIILVFSEIRDGKYKFYGKFNFPWIVECLRDFLDRKYQIRENLSFAEVKHDFTTREEYLAAVERGRENEKQLIKLKQQNDEMGFKKFKAEFAADQSNRS